MDHDGRPLATLGALSPRQQPPTVPLVLVSLDSSSVHECLKMSPPTRVYTFAYKDCGFKTERNTCFSSKIACSQKSPSPNRLGQLHIHRQGWRADGFVIARVDPTPLPPRSAKAGNSKACFCPHRLSQCPTRWPTTCTGHRGGSTALRPSATTSWSSLCLSSCSSDGGCAFFTGCCRSFSR